MTRIETITQPDLLKNHESGWNELRKGCVFDSTSCQQYIDAVTSDSQVLSAAVMIVFEAEELRAIIPFAVFERPRKFTLGEFRVFNIQHRVLHILGSILGELDRSQAKTVLQQLSAWNNVDAINLYELPTRHSLYIEVAAPGSNIKTSAALASTFPHWITELPDSFEQYLAGFKSKTRKNYRREMRNFQAAYALRLEKITRAEQVENFLQTGESISRQTYQWNLGVRLVCDQTSIDAYKLSAQQGELACYLLFADDRPVAFVKGQIVNGVFHYGTPGFLRAYAEWSPGKLMLFMVLEDLIENTDCRRFDFGMGGDYTGYKSMFGNANHEAAIVEIYPCKTLKSRFLYMLDRLFWHLKRLLRVIISPERKSRIRKLLRKIGLLK